MREKASRGLNTFALTADVKEGHRQIPIDPRDWHLLGCQVDRGGDVFINTVGTFGITSASYYWSRVSSAVGRLWFSLCSAPWWESRSLGIRRLGGHCGLGRFRTSPSNPTPGHLSTKGRVVRTVGSGDGKCRLHSLEAVRGRFGADHVRNRGARA